MPDTYRVYLRWPRQRVSEKTTTPSSDLAGQALRSLVMQHRGENAAAVMSFNGQQQDYVELADNRRCDRCLYVGPFIDLGETCPNCLLVQ